MTARKSSATPPIVRLPLSASELETLVALAMFYQKSMGSFRHVVRLASGPETRRRFRFMEAESDVLKQFAEAQQTRLQERGTESLPVEFTVPALVAFWGRLLAGLNKPHARRKLSASEIARREELAGRIAARVSDVYPRHERAIEQAIATRRAPEQEWIRAALKEQTAIPG